MHCVHPVTCERRKWVFYIVLADLSCPPQAKWWPLCTDHVYPKGEENGGPDSAFPLHRASSWHSHDDSQEPPFPHQEGCTGWGELPRGGPLSFGSSEWIRFLEARLLIFLLFPFVFFYLIFGSVIWVFKAKTLLLCIFNATSLFNRPCS